MLDRMVATGSVGTMPAAALFPGRALRKAGFIDAGFAQTEAEPRSGHLSEETHDA